jgi:hypothetical protein
MTPVMTPFLKAGVAGSFPMLVEILLLSRSAHGSPYMKTVVEPFSRSLIRAVLGYGTGTPTFGGSGGEPQTSGKAAALMPIEEAFPAIDMLLA